MFYDRQKRFVNPSPSRRSEFSNPNRRDRFSNSIPSFDGSFDVESIYFWSINLMGCLTWSIFPWRIKSSLWPPKLKGRAAVWWNQFQNIRMYEGKPHIRTWRRMRRLLQTRSLALEEKEMEIRPNLSWGLISQTRQRSNISNHQLKSNQPKDIHQIFKRLSAKHNLSMKSWNLYHLFLVRKKRSQISCPYAIKASSSWSQRI